MKLLFKISGKHFKNISNKNNEEYISLINKNIENLNNNLKFIK